MPRHLQKRRRRWYAVLDIPADVRPRFGGTRKFVQSLETESLTEAERKVPLLVAGWRADIEEARTGRPSATRHEFVAHALEWQRHLREARARDDQEGHEHGEPGDPPSAYDAADLLLHDHLEELDAADPKLAQDFARIAYGKSLPTAHHLEAWLATLRNTPKTLDEKRLSVTRFAEVFPFTHQVDRTKVRGWVRSLQDDKGLSLATVTKDVSQVRGYWHYLQEREVVAGEVDPFREVLSRAKKASRADPEEARKPFMDDQLGQLLRAADATGYPHLGDLIRLAMWTGCRIEELCAMKLTEVSTDRIKVTDAKTKAGDRVVPLHDSVKPLIAKLRKESQDGFLLGGLTFNKYGDRSNAIGKRFGRLRDALGFGGDLVFHSIRKTVATKLENAGVPEGVAADILGHKKKTMTYGLYSGGTDFGKKAEAIAKLAYDIPSEVLRAA